MTPPGFLCSMACYTPIMSERKTIRLERPHLNAIEQMDADGLVDNETEAHRKALDRGLTELGYLNGTTTDTLLRRTFRRLRDVFGLFALFWIGTTFLFPVGFRIWAIPLIVVGIGFHAADRLAARYEPRLSARLFGRGDAA